MPNWYDITRNPEYQSLPEEDRIDVKRTFFNETIGKNPEFSALDDTSKQATWMEFMQSPDDTGQGIITSTIGGAARGFGEIVPGAIQGFGALTGIGAAEKAGEAVRSGLNYIAPVNPLYEESIPVKAAGVAGQVGSVLATAGAGGLAGKALAAERIAAGASAAEQALAASQAISRGANATLYGSAGLQGAASGAQTADQYGLTGLDRYGNIIAGGLIETGTELLPFGLGAETAAAKRLLGVAPRAGRFAGDVFSEAGEETVGQVASNAALSALAPAGTETPGLLDGAVEAGLYGGLGGGILGGVNVATGAYKKPATLPQSIPAPVQEAVAQAEESVIAASDVAPLTAQALAEAQKASEDAFAFAENLRRTQEEGAAADIQAAQMRAQEEYAAAQAAAERQAQFDNLTPNEPIAPAPVGTPVSKIGTEEVANLEAGSGDDPILGIGDDGGAVLEEAQLEAPRQETPQDLAGGPAVAISDRPSANLSPRASSSVEPRPARNGRDTSARDAWDEKYGRMRKDGITHNDDGTPYQPTIFDEVATQVMAARQGMTDDEATDAIGDWCETSIATSLKTLINAGWTWNTKERRMVPPSGSNQNESPLRAILRLQGKTPEVVPDTEESLATQAPRITELARQAAAIASGAEKGSNLKFPRVAHEMDTMPLKDLSNYAKAQGMNEKESVSYARGHIAEWAAKIVDKANGLFGKSIKLGFFPSKISKDGMRVVASGKGMSHKNGIEVDDSQSPLHAAWVALHEFAHQLFPTQALPKEASLAKGLHPKGLEDIKSKTKAEKLASDFANWMLAKEYPEHAASIPTVSKPLADFFESSAKPLTPTKERTQKPSQTITGSNAQTGAEMPVQSKTGEATITPTTETPTPATEGQPMSGDSGTPSNASTNNYRGETASWVIRNKETGEVIEETFNPAKVKALNTKKYEAVPIGDYLESLNKPASKPKQGDSGSVGVGKVRKIKQTVNKIGGGTKEVSIPVVFDKELGVDILAPEANAILDEAKWPDTFSSPFHPDYALKDQDSYFATWGDGENTSEVRKNYRELMELAVRGRKPVSEYGWKVDLRNPIPEGYVKDGELYVYKPEAKAEKAPTEIPSESLSARLNAAKSREEAREILNGVKNLLALKDLAKEMGYPTTGTKKDVVNRLVAAVGSRFDAAAIRDSGKAEEKETFRYEMRARPPSIGTHPKEGFISHKEGGNRHGFLTYDRPLTEKEIYDYELKPVATESNQPTSVESAKPTKSGGADKSISGEQDQRSERLASTSESDNRANGDVAEKPKKGDLVTVALGGREYPKTRIINVTNTLEGVRYQVDVFGPKFVAESSIVAIEKPVIKTAPKVAATPQLIRQIGDIAVKNKKPLDQGYIDSVGGNIPQGYVKQGDLYVFQPEKQAPSEKVEAGKVVTSEQIEAKVEELLRAPTKATKKPAVVFGTQTEEAAFKRGFSAAVEKQGEMPPPEKTGLSPKDRKWDDAWRKGWASGQTFVRSLPESSTEEVKSGLISNIIDRFRPLPPKGDIFGRLARDAQRKPLSTQSERQRAINELTEDVKRQIGNDPAEIQRFNELLGLSKTNKSIPRIATAFLEQADALVSEQPATMEEAFGQDMSELQVGDVVSWVDEDGKLHQGAILSRKKDVYQIADKTQEATVRLPRHELSMINDAGKESRTKALDSIIGTPQGVEMNAVSAADGQESLALVHNSGDVPGVLNAFVGTSKEFLANPQNEKDYPELFAILKNGRVDEGNFAYGRAFVFTDGIGVNASDRANAAKLGISPAVAAVRRVLIHEGLVHRGIYGLPARLQMQILQWVKQNAKPEDLDALAKTYPQYADWATNPQQMLGLAEEFLAKNVEKMTRFPTSGPLARLVEILKDIWRYVTGKDGEPTVQNLRDIVKLLKAGAKAADARLVNGGGIKMSQLRAQGFVTPEMDAEYAKAVADGDVAKQQAMVDEAAKTAGAIDPITASVASTSDQDTGAYHYGDAGVGRDTVLSRMSGGRGTGHFGTGTYFLGKEDTGARAGRPLKYIDLSGLNMAKPRQPYELHDSLRLINKMVLRGEKPEYAEPRFDGRKAQSGLWIALDTNSKERDIREAIDQTFHLFETGKNDGVRTPATYVMQFLGYDGIDVRGTEADNTDYGSVVYPPLTDGYWHHGKDASDMTAVDLSKSGQQTNEGGGAFWVSSNPMTAKTYRTFGLPNVPLHKQVQPQSVLKDLEAMGESVNASKNYTFKRHDTGIIARKLNGTDKERQWSIVSEDMQDTEVKVSAWLSQNDYYPVSEDKTLLKLFVFYKNPLVADGGGKLKLEPWRGLTDKAKSDGNDAVVVKNTVDTRGTMTRDSGQKYIGTTVGVFNPNQIKSADPITRDNAGNVIPLSQRFNPAKADIRESRISYANPLDAQLASASERMRQMREKQGAQETPISDDARYLELAKDPEKNQAELRRMVDEASDVDGFNIDAFHGTPSGGFNSFAPSEKGLFFVNKPEIAETYTSKRGIFLSKGKNPQVFAVKLKLTNPLTINALGNRWDNIPFPGETWKPKVFGNLPSGAINVNEAVKRAFAAGYDGVIIENVMDSVSQQDRTKATVYAVSNPNQIKSADAIVKDDSGKIIPLSQRFGSSNDIRGVLPGQIRNEIRKAYDAAIQGQGSVQAPLQQVYDIAKAAIPTLTERQFGEQVQALYEDGSAFLVPTDRSADMLAAGEKWGVYDVAGLPASYLGVMPSQETNYGNDISTNTNNIRPRGTMEPRGGAQEYGGNTPTLSPNDKSPRANALRAVVDESTWRNLSPEQKKNALDAFGAKRLEAIASKSSLLSASYRITRTPSDHAFAAILPETNADRLVVEINPSIHPEHQILNKSALEAYAFMYDMMQEEIIHFAQHYNAWQQWVNGGAKGSINAFENEHFTNQLRDVYAQRDAAIRAGNSTLVGKIDSAIVNAWNLYDPSRQISNIGQLQGALAGADVKLPEFMMELTRQLVQINRQDFTTETGWAKFRDMLIKWANDVRDALRNVLASVRGGEFGQILKDEISSIERIVDQIEKGGGVMPTEIKASKAQKDVDTAIHSARGITGKVDKIVNGLPANSYTGKPLQDAMSQSFAPLGSQQFYDETKALIVGAIDDMVKRGIDSGDILATVIQPDFTEEAMKGWNESAKSVAKSIYFNHGLLLAVQKQEQLMNDGDITAANKQQDKIDAWSKFWFNLTNNFGVTGNAIQRAMEDPAYQGLYLLTNFAAQTQKAQKEVTDSNIANPNEVAKDINEVGAKSKTDADSDVADALTGIQVEDEIAAGEAALTPENRTLWERAKSILRSLARIAKAETFFATKGIKASNAAESADEEVARYIQMGPKGVGALKVKLQKEFGGIVAKLTGTEKTGTARKPRTPKEEAVHPLIARLIARTAAKLNAGTNLDAALADLMPETPSYRDRIVDDVVSGIVGRANRSIKKPVAPKTLADLTKQLKRILSENIKVEQKTLPEESLGKKALRAFGYVASNEKIIEDAWKKARNKVQETLQEENKDATPEEVETLLNSLMSEAPKQLYSSSQARAIIRESLDGSKFDNSREILDDVNGAREAVLKSIEDAVKQEKLANPDQFQHDPSYEKSYILNAFDALVADLQKARDAGVAASNKAVRDAVFGTDAQKALKIILRKLTAARPGIDAPLAPALAWKRLFEMTQTDQGQIKGRMFDIVKDEPAFADLDNTDKQKLADILEKSWDARRQQILTNELERLRIKHRNRLTKKAAKVFDNRPAILKKIDSGVFDYDDLAVLIGAEFGIKPLTAAENKRAKEISARLSDDIPPYERTKLQNELQEMMVNKNLSLGEMLKAWWISAVLTGPRTAFTIGWSFLSGGYELIGHAATVLLNPKMSMAEKGAAIGDSIKNWWSSIAPEIRSAYMYVLTGDKTLQDPAALMQSAFFDNQFRKEMGRFSFSVAEKMITSKNPLIRYAGWFMTYGSRILNALDAFNFNITKAGSAPLVYSMLNNSYKAGSFQTSKLFKEARKKIIANEYGGTEPADTSRLNSWARNAAYQELSKITALAENMNQVARQSNFTLDPTGFGGWLYSGLKFADAFVQKKSEAFVTRMKQDLLQGGGSKFDKAIVGIAELIQAGAMQTLPILGLQFAKFALNKLNQTISFIPVAGFIRLKESSVEGQRVHEAMIYRNQAVGAFLFSWVYLTLKAIEDEPDDEKRGWGIEGGWSNLTPQEKRQRDAAGLKEHTIWWRGKDGKRTVANFMNWPISPILAAAGAMSDQIKYSPEQWAQGGVLKRGVTMGWAMGKSVSETSALSQFTELFGSSMASRDPVEAFANKAARVFGGYAGGYIPRIFKDIDRNMQPEIRKYEGWEYLGKELPYYRRYIGKEYLDIFGNVIAPSQTPWSREFVHQPASPEYEMLSRVNSHGVWLSPAVAENRLVGKGTHKREMTDDEANRYVKIVGKGYSDLILKYGERIIAMPKDKAKKFVAEKADDIRDRATKQAVRKPIAQ